MIATVGSCRTAAVAASRLATQEKSSEVARCKTLPEHKTCVEQAIGRSAVETPGEEIARRVATNVVRKTLGTTCSTTERKTLAQASQVVLGAGKYLRLVSTGGTAYHPSIYVANNHAVELSDQQMLRLAMKRVYCIVCGYAVDAPSSSRADQGYVIALKSTIFMTEHIASQQPNSEVYPLAEQMVIAKLIQKVISKGVLIPNLMDGRTIRGKALIKAFDGVVSCICFKAKCAVVLAAICFAMLLVKKVVLVKGVSSGIRSVIYPTRCRGYHPANESGEIKAVVSVAGNIYGEGFKRVADTIKTAIRRRASLASVGSILSAVARTDL